VTIYYLFANGTLDTLIMRKLDYKFSLLNRTLNGVENIGKFEPTALKSRSNSRSGSEEKHIKTSIDGEAEDFKEQNVYMSSMSNVFTTHAITEYFPVVN